ncbi:hypothetical protein PO124_20220 [Bacillus licheniformis]|nr:hypothetical protein [Bacillus licheniformis]
MNRMKRGDYLLIQFGINDAGQDPARHTDPYTTFQEYLRTYINKAREKEDVMCSSLLKANVPMMKRAFSTTASENIRTQ